MAQTIEWFGFTTLMASTPLSRLFVASSQASGLWTLMTALSVVRVQKPLSTPLNCPTARAILTLGGLDGRLLNKDYPYCIDWIKDVMCFLDKKVIADFITALWNSWNNRNNYVFYGKEEEARVIWDRAKNLCQDFRIHNLINKPVLPLTLALKKWEKPPCGTVKINFDATVFNNKTGFGVIVHDSDGFILGGGGGFKYEDMMAEWVKLYAFEEDITIIGYRIKEAFKTMEMFTTTAVNWANCSCNKIAAFICKNAITNNCNLVFGMDYPKDIHDL
ncbi:hypothetical protein Golob_014302, partial [Gossypium lobatum]|nr:hypothetical protein [Gossypium lobatum]